MGAILQHPIDYVPENSYWSFVRQTVFLIKDKDKRRSSERVLQKALYKCRCGVEKEHIMTSIRNGQSLSCGCYSAEQTSKRAVRHGYHSHPAYRVWAHLKRRCYNVKAKEYPNYGGRGVEVCDEWKNNPGKFVEWAIQNGWAKGLDIDKDIKAKELGLDPLLYSPEMCQFVTRRHNLSERRNSVKITYNGFTKTMAQWDEDMGFTKGTLRRRIIKYKWSVEKAFTEPIKKNENRKNA